MNDYFLLYFASFYGLFLFYIINTNYIIQFLNVHFFVVFVRGSTTAEQRSANRSITGGTRGIVSLMRTVSCLWYTFEHAMPAANLRILKSIHLHQSVDLLQTSSSIPDLKCRKTITSSPVRVNDLCVWLANEAMSNGWVNSRSDDFKKGSILDWYRHRVTEPRAGFILNTESKCTLHATGREQQFVKARPSHAHRSTGHLQLLVR